MKIYYFSKLYRVQFFCIKGNRLQITGILTEPTLSYFSPISISRKVWIIFSAITTAANS